MNKERINFTTRVLGPAAAYRLEKHQVTQTLRSGSDIIANAIINGRASAGDRLEIILDNVLVGEAELISMDAVTLDSLTIEDALRGGFDSISDLAFALKRAGYRFKPLEQYQFYRVQFAWLD
ncbi:hypothetical protein ES703_70704 [subsurface metagenome]